MPDSRCLPFADAVSDPPEPQSLQSIVADLWRQARPAVLERIAVLHDAATDPLTPERRAAARAEAHKLVGLLGSYGIGDGSELARVAEQQLADEDRFDGVALASIADQLRELVEHSVAEPG